jgi:hypothetical protein
MNESVSASESAVRCLERTRSAVLNVLVVSALGIAVSGLLLRWRDGWALFRRSAADRPLMAALFTVAVLSYATRRLMIARLEDFEPTAREARFFQAHLLAALLAATAVPLGLAYGWLIRPRLDAVGPFWVAALALGFLALPHIRDLEALHGLEPTDSNSLPSEPNP